MTARSFRGVIQIVRFNWHFYAAGVVAVTVGWFGVGPVALVAGAWLLGSLAVCHYIYDRSELTRWAWLPVAPRKWANIHCGFDETSRPLRRLWPGTTGLVLDIFDRGTMTEASLARARRIETGAPPAIPADFRALPVGDGELDTVFLLFAAHELRAVAARADLFAEVRRVLSPGGQAVLVEHLRDAANFLAFGPGCWHFLPRGEWLRLARGAQLAVEDEAWITPFVRLFVLRRESEA